MASRREKAPSKRMRRIALVICEGESEAGYVDLVRKWYKSPIRIITHVARQSINQGVVDKHAGDLKISDGDKVSVFLMYDMDVPAVNEKLKRCEAELRRYEQVSELTVTLLEKWLVTYKFKDWCTHSNGESVTDKEKSERAKNIARELGDNKRWKAHGRPIDINALRGLKLMITELETQDARDDIREFHKLYRDYKRLHSPSYPTIFTVLQ